jgi:hypothetical protein
MLTVYPPVPPLFALPSNLQSARSAGVDSIENGLLGATVALNHFSQLNENDVAWDGLPTNPAIPDQSFTPADVIGHA